MGQSHSDRGATSVEYALVVFLIAGVITITVATLGQTVAALFGPVLSSF